MRFIMDDCNIRISKTLSYRKCAQGNWAGRVRLCTHSHSLTHPLQMLIYSEEFNLAHSSGGMWRRGRGGGGVRGRPRWSDIPIVSPLALWTQEYIKSGFGLLTFAQSDCEEGCQGARRSSPLLVRELQRTGYRLPHRTFLRCRLAEYLILLNIIARIRIMRGVSLTPAPGKGFPKIGPVDLLEFCR